MKRLIALIAAAVALCALMLAQGCASGQRTTSVTTVTRVNGGAVTSQTTPGNESADLSPTDSNTPPATITTTTTTQSGDPDSVLGATLNLVSTIILLPFRIVGDVLGAIF
jgi:hypothetical protein